MMRRILLIAVLASLTMIAPLDAQENLRRTYVVKVFEANRDAVVNVNTTQVVRQRFGTMDPFFRRLFNVRERDVKRTSLGSGFIVHRDGYIVTNAHVVDGADEIDVILADGTHLPAKVLASDATQDLAVLKVEPPQDVELKAVTLGDSSDLMIGEPVIAIGNPLGYEHTVTTGIVSANNRTLEVTPEWKLEALIQTDAPINPGSSGGPLLNAYGQVIGINSAIRGDGQNIGFAIAVNSLRSLLPQLMNPLQLNGVDIGGRVVERRTIEAPADVKVALQWLPHGHAGTPLPLTAINGVAVTNIVEAYVQLLQCTVGEAISLTCGSQTVELVAKMAPLSDGQRLARSMLGVDVKELSASEARRHGISRGGGLLVQKVDPEGPAAAGGLHAGDILVHVGAFRIADLKALAGVLSQARGGMPADVYVIRDGQIGRARVTLRESTAGSL